MNILLAGASGNLGSLLTKYLLSRSHHLRLLTHKRALPLDLPQDANVKIIHGDLNDPAALRTVCESINCIVYLAGVLFQPHPENFPSDQHPLRSGHGWRGDGGQCEKIYSGEIAPR